MATAVSNDGVNIKGSGGKDPLSFKHPVYEANEEAWGKYRTLYEGGWKIAESDFIQKIEVESNESFKRRKQRAFDFRNVPASVISIYVSNIFRQAPKRPFLTGDGAKKELQAIAKDIDRQGSSVNPFFRKTLASSMAEGVSHVLVDLPRLPDQYKNQPKTKGHKAQLNIHPFLKLFKPQDVLDWEIESEDPKTLGKLKWVKIRYPFIPKANDSAPTWMQEKKQENAFLIYTKDQWEVYIREKGKPKLLYTGENAFGEVPLVQFYAHKTGAMVGRSLLHDIGPLSYVQYNKLSQRDEAEMWASFPILFLMTKEGKSVSNLGIGRNRAIKLAQGDEAKYLTVPAESVEMLRDTTKELQGAMLAIALRQLSTYEADKGGVESSEQRAMARADLTASMVDWAISFQRSESEVWRLLAKAESISDEDEYPVIYNQEYDYETIAEQLASALNIRDLKVPSAKFNEEYYKNLVDKILPDLEPSARKEIEKELKEYTEKTKNGIPGLEEAKEMIQNAMSVVASLEQGESGKGAG